MTTQAIATTKQNISELHAHIDSLKSQITRVKQDVQSQETEIDAFEYSISEDDFDEYLNEIGEPCNFGELIFYPSDILKHCDPVAYRCAKSEYESDYDLDDCEEYQDLQSELEDLNGQLEMLEDELSECEDQLIAMTEELTELESNQFED